MTIIRSVTESVPASREILQDSPIPLGFTITPYASRTDLVTTVSTTDTIFPASKQAFRYDYPLENSSNNVGLPIKASILAKCTHCGAPMNPFSPLLSLETALCALCGHTFPVDFESQRKARDRAESLLLGRKTKQSFEDEKQAYTERWNRHKALEECNHVAIEYSLPLIHVPDDATETYTPIYSLPARACPPLLALLIDGTSTDALYYNTLSSTLTQWLLAQGDTETRKGTRMGLFIMTQYGGLSIFDLSSTVAHLKHIYVPVPPLPSLNLESEINSHPPSDSCLGIHDVLDFHQVFVPLDVNHSLTRIETALRALADYTTVIQDTCTRPSFSPSSYLEHGATPGGVYLGSTIHTLLRFLEDIGANHPGSKEEDMDHGSILYAGGKFYCFLAGPPFEIGTTTYETQLSDSKNENHVSYRKYHFSGTIGRGGFGGACAPIGKRFDFQALNSQRIEDHTMFSSDDVEAVPTRNGRQDFDSNLDRPIPMSANLLNVGNYYERVGIACARAAIGIEIFSVITLDEDRFDKFIGLPVLRLLSQYSGGNGPIMVPVRRSPESKSDILSRELLSRSPWHRPHAYGATLKIRLSRSLTLLNDDYDATTPTFSRHGFQWRYSVGTCIHGSVSPLGHDNSLLMMGTCDDFSTISFNMDISSKSGSASNIEIDELSIELPPCIQSSFVYTALIKDGNGYIAVRRLRVLTMTLTVVTEPEQFFKSLDAEVLGVILFHKLCDISLNQGLREAHVFGRHWLLSALMRLYRSAKLNSNRNVDSLDYEVWESLQGNQSLPLLIFCLMQSDALRLTDANFRPSMDSRASASANMFNMPPSSLARCIAPRLELWYLDSQSTAISVESLDMSLSYLHSSTRESMNASKPMTEIQKKRISDALNEAVLSYRVAPPIEVSFDSADTWIASPYITDSLIEDSNEALCHLNFRDWCADIGEIVSGNVK